MKDSDDIAFSREGKLQLCQDRSGSYAAPLGAITCGRLIFPSGVSRARLRGDLEIADLFRARFAGQAPSVHVYEGSVTIRYRQPAMLDWRGLSRQPEAEIELNARIPWEIEFHDGVSRTNLDLRELQLRSLDILGGASQVAIALAKPSGTTFIYLAGGASKVAIHRPAGVGVRLQVHGGSSRLALDDQRFGAIGGETQLESPGFQSAASRVEINISGGASGLKIGWENNPP